MTEHDRIGAIDEVLREWLREPGVALVCGRWGDGGIMELVLEEGTRLSRPRYAGTFAGLRDIVLPGHAHHMHVDLARVARVTYAVTPSVCYGFSPSFDVRFTGVSDEPIFSVTMLSPYVGGELAAPRVARYFARLRDDAARYPALLSFVADDGGRLAEHAHVWSAVGSCFARGAGLEVSPPNAGALVEAVRSRYAVSADAPSEALSPILRVLDDSLALRGASFVVYRARTLIEFKTERLRRRVSAYEEGGHRSWQIGAFEDHHCHLDLDSIERVLFDAEPVSCQRGRLNWTVWFLSNSDAGNPYRASAVCSVTLNRPHTDAGERDRSVVDPMYELFDRVRGLDFVSASRAFIEGR
jgi:hypothetical protein